MGTVSYVSLHWPSFFFLFLFGPKGWKKKIERKKNSRPQTLTRLILPRTPLTIQPRNCEISIAEEIKNGGPKVSSAPQRLRLRCRIRSRRWLRSMLAFLSKSFPLFPLFTAPVTRLRYFLQFFKIQLFSLTSIPPDEQKVSVLLHLFCLILACPCVRKSWRNFVFFCSSITFSTDLWLWRWSPCGKWLRSRHHFRETAIGFHRRTWTAGRIKHSEYRIDEIRRGVGQTLAGAPPPLFWGNFGSFFRGFGIGCKLRSAYHIYLKLIIFLFFIYFSACVYRRRRKHWCCSGILRSKIMDNLGAEYGLTLIKSKW